MKLKFCGLTRIEDIEAANETRPDYIGFVFADSRRHVSDLDAARLKEHLDPEIKTVGVFVNDEPEHIAALVKDEVIDLIQLHGDENEHYIKKLRRLTNAPIIYAVRVETHRDIEEADRLPVVSAARYLCKACLRRQRKDLRLVADRGDQPPVFPRRGA